MKTTPRKPGAEKRPRGRPPVKVSLDEIQRAQRDAKAEIERRSELVKLEHDLKQLRPALSVLESLDYEAPTDHDLRRVIQKMEIRVKQLEKHGYARPDETERQATHRILRARGHGRASVQRAILGEEIDGRMAADRAGMNERPRRARIDEMREKVKREWMMTELSPEQKRAVDDLWSAVDILLKLDTPDNERSNR